MTQAVLLRRRWVITGLPRVNVIYHAYNYYATERIVLSHVCVCLCVCMFVCGCRWPFHKMVMLQPLLMISAVINSNHRCNMQLMAIIINIDKLHTWSNFCMALWAILIAEFQSVKHSYNWSTISMNNTWKITTKYMTDNLVNIDLVEIGSSSVALDWTWSISYLQAAKVMIARGHIALQSCII